LATAKTGQCTPQIVGKVFILHMLGAEPLKDRVHLWVGSHQCGKYHIFFEVVTVAQHLAGVLCQFHCGRGIDLIRQAVGQCL